jgi:hypothetical protein
MFFKRSVAAAVARHRAIRPRGLFDRRSGIRRRARPLLRHTTSPLSQWFRHQRRRFA